MGKIFLLIGLTFLLVGCKKSVTSSEITSISETIAYDYDVVQEKMIMWNDLFSIEKEKYSTYIYSTRCGHCNEIKQEVISHALNDDSFYFVEYNQNIPITDNVESTIGKSSVEDISILGTPTLLVIENKILIKNIAGAKAILEAI